MARLIDNLDLLSKGRTDGPQADLRGRRRGPRRHDPRAARLRPEARLPILGRRRPRTSRPTCSSARLARGYAVELNQATLPRLLVNRRYYQELKSGPQDKGSRAWLSECLQSASWLVKALDQRARTIVKVVSEIVKRQQGFFDRGVSAMKPMTLREVAEAIEMHEFDRQPRHLEQISALRPRTVRAQIFLRLRRSVGRRRRRRGRGSEGGDQGR